MFFLKITFIIVVSVITFFNTNGQDSSLNYFFNQINKLKEFEDYYQKNENKSIKFPEVTFKKNYILGDSSKKFVLLKDYFEQTMDLQRNDHLPYYDINLRNAIINYQFRNGLEQNGMITNETVNKLRQPFNSLLSIIKINIERCRILESLSGKDIILINIPDYKLYVIEDGLIKFEHKVIIGKSSTPTPSFESKIEEIILSPYWYIPQSIFHNELIPALEKNPKYMKLHQMEFYGETARQLPGAENSLGQIKFNFSNPYSVYLHDTPIKSLFGKNKRAFSHGCIRLENPILLASYLLNNEEGWSVEKIEKEIKKNKETIIKIKKPVSILVVYLTCWVDANNQLHFADDIYKKD